MDLTFGEQVVALVATLAALTVAGFTIAAVLIYGAATAGALFGLGMGAFVVARLAIGFAIRPRGAASEPDSGDDTTN